jgi:hypothetical protein
LRRRTLTLAGLVVTFTLLICLAQTVVPGVTVKALAFATRTVLAPIPVRTSDAYASLTVSPLGQGLINGREYPISFRPYARTSPWNTRVSAQPTFAAYSAAVISHEFAGESSIIRNQEAGPYDYGRPIYYSTDADPLIKIVCNQFCPTTNRLSQMRIPPKARPGGGTDAMMVVIQPNGREYDFWAAYGSPGSDPTWTAPHNAQTRDWRNGDTLTAGGAADCGDFIDGPGDMPIGPGADAGGSCLGAGMMRPNELAAGHINHALFIVLQCAIGDQYPATNGAQTQRCTSGIGPPLGGHLWLDIPAARIAQMPGLAAWEKAILIAMNEYGGYFMDNDNGGAYATGFGLIASSTQPAYSFGQPDPFSSLGWQPVRPPGSLMTRWIGADPWRPAGIDFAAHMHWLDVCSAKARC